MENFNKYFALGRGVVITIIILTQREYFLLTTYNQQIINMVLTGAVVYTLFTLFVNFKSETLKLFYNFIDVVIVTVLLFFLNKMPLYIIFYAIVLLAAFTEGFQLSIIIFLSAGVGLSFLFFMQKVSLSLMAINISCLLSSAIFFPFLQEVNRRKNLEEMILEEEQESASLKRKIEELQGKIKQDTVYDLQTGLNNQKYFNMQIDKEMTKARRYKYTFAVIIFGIDNFKLFNSVYGTKKGDEVLRIIGMLLLAYVRNSDSVARIDGTDKFLIYFPFTDSQQSLIPLERFKEAVKKYKFDEKNPKFSLTISAGVSSFPEDGDELKILMDKAEAALKRSKAQGKDKILKFGSN